MPPRPQAMPMPTATMATQRYLASRASRKSDSASGATANSSAAPNANPAAARSRDRPPDRLAGAVPAGAGAPAVLGGAGVTAVMRGSWSAG